MPPLARARGNQSEQLIAGEAGLGSRCIGRYRVPIAALVCRRFSAKFVGLGELSGARRSEWRCDALRAQTIGGLFRFSRPGQRALPLAGVLALNRARATLCVRHGASMRVGSLATIAVVRLRNVW
jgi:hypothetical protein